MTTRKSSSTLLPNYPPKTRGAKLYPNLSDLCQGHTSGPGPTAAPCNSTSMPMAPGSEIIVTTTRSGYTCATVNISQAAFMQPSKAKERHYSFPFTTTYLTACITSGATAQLCPGGTDGTCLTTSKQRGRGRSTHGFSARRRRYR